MTKGIPNKPSEPPTQDEFAQWVTDGIRKAGATADIVYDRERFCLSQGDKDGTVLFLANAYKEYCSAPEPMRPQVLQRYVRSWFMGAITLPEAFDDLHPDLLPIVRTRSYFDLARMNTGKGAVLPHQVLGEHLAVGLVYDLPQAMRSITQDDLDGWGVSFYEALEAARHNLTQLEHAFIGPKEGEGVYLSTARDGYDSSRLILLDLIRRVSGGGRLRGDGAQPRHADRDRIGRHGWLEGDVGIGNERIAAASSHLGHCSPARWRRLGAVVARSIPSPFQRVPGIAVAVHRSGLRRTKGNA